MSNVELTKEATQTSYFNQQRLQERFQKTTPMNVIAQSRGLKRCHVCNRQMKITVLNFDFLAEPTELTLTCFCSNSRCASRGQGRQTLESFKLEITSRNGIKIITDPEEQTAFVKTIVKLTDIPNCGNASARKLENAGVKGPADLYGGDAKDLSQKSKVSQPRIQAMIDFVEKTFIHLAEKPEESTEVIESTDPKGKTEDELADELYSGQSTPED